MVLRPLRELDVDEFFALYEGERARVQRWSPAMRVVNTRGHFQNIARVSAKRLAQGRDIELLVCVEGEIAGTIGVENVDRINDSATVGCWIATRFEGRGIMSAAMSNVTAFANDRYGLHRLEATTSSANERMNALLERGGWQKEALQRDKLALPGRGYEDANLYVMISPNG